VLTDCCVLDPQAAGDSPWLADLTRRCDVILIQAQAAPIYVWWIKRHNELSSKYEAALKDQSQDFSLIASLGQLRVTHAVDRRALVIDGQVAATLPQRCDELMREVEQRCRELLAAGMYAPLQVLGTKLKLLQAQDLSCLPAPAIHADANTAEDLGWDTDLGLPER
jgi:hypothetical protein